MSEKLVGLIVETLGGSMSREIIVFIVSMLPILELRGGIICGFALGLELIPTFVIAYIGNILPVPFILVFIRFIFNWLKKTPLRNIILKIEDRADKKSDTVKKYAYLGLLLFVGIPLPGTGAWTGSLIASMLNMENKKAFGTIALGVLMAGVIIASLSYGLLGALGIGGQ